MLEPTPAEHIDAVRRPAAGVDAGALVRRDASDTRLIEASQGGDAEAFAVLVARHHGLVRAACVRAAPDGDEDDCLQAVFLVMSRRLRQAARAPALSAWLLRTATLVCRCAHRDRRRRRRAESAAATVAATRVSGPGRMEALDHLDECLIRLPERQRVAVSMHYLAGRSPEDVAIALGISRDNAYQLLSRGLAGLRALLSRRGFAVSATAIASVLASEAEAAHATIPAAQLAAVTSAPSAKAATLTAGALSAMTIASLTPIAGATALLLAAATASIVLCAEPTTPAAPTPPAAATAPWDPLPAHPRFEQRISVEWADIPVSDGARFIAQTCGIVMDASALHERRFSMQVAGMRVADIMACMAILCDARITVRQDAILLLPAAGSALPEHGDLPDPAMREQLSVRITASFADSDATKTCDFMRRVSNLNILVHPRVRGTVTMQATKQPVGDVLAHVATALSARLVLCHGAIWLAPAADQSEAAAAR